jgi:hypothetical protein
MTEGTCKERLQVARLDRAKMPLGYVMGEAAGGFVWHAGRENGKVYMTPDGALQSAWEHCEGENDPPGMWLGRSVSQDGSRETWSFGVGDESRPAQADLPTRDSALATAWAHYWRRVELVRRMEALTHPRYRLQAPAAWPEVLAWSREQVTQVEKDLAEAESFQSRKATERPRDRDGQGNPIDPDADYYVQEADGGASGLVGNCMRFWREGGAGYTCQLGEAGIYKGRACLRMRPTDIPWRVAFIREHAVMHVRMDMLPKAGA